MTDVGQMIADRDPVALGHSNRSSSCVRQERMDVRPLSSDNNVVAQDHSECVEPLRIVCQGVLQNDAEVPQDMEMASFRPTVLCVDDRAVERRMNRLAPRVEVRERRPHQEVAPDRASAPLPARVLALYPQEVEREPLAELIGAVAGNTFRGSVIRHPFATQRKIDDDRILVGRR